VIANYNCLGQLVISSAGENIARAADRPKPEARRALFPLQVSGAFHSPLMQPAVDGMAQVLAKVTFKDTSVPVIGNVTAQPLTSGGQIKDELLKQLYSGVQWQRSVEYMPATKYGKIHRVWARKSACRPHQAHQPGR